MGDNWRTQSFHDIGETRGSGRSALESCLEFKICALVYNKKMIEYCIALFCCMDDSPLYILLCGLHSRTHRQAPFEARSRASAVRSDACSDRLEIGGLETKHSGSFGTDELDAVSLLGLVV